MSENYTEAFCAIVELHEALGEAPLNGRMWSFEIDERVALRSERRRGRGDQRKPGDEHPAIW